METTKQHQKKRPKPRLDRRNAMKNINYDASTSPTSPSSCYSSSSSFDDHQFGGIRTHRSLDLSPLSNQTSFRIQGDFDGEFDLICRSLGFSGPEDFAIPADAWEARKVLLSPSDNLHRSRLRSVEASPKEEEDVVLLGRFEGGASSSSNEVIELENGCVQFENCSDLVRGSGENECVDLKLVGVERVRNGGGGIKGVRPPYLAPPPVIVRAAVVDNVSSTWDICRSFGPDDGECSNSDGKFEENEDIDEAVDEREEELDDDCLSNSTMVVTVYSISPNGKFRHNIESWQKGDFLGSGSFGTVYEGYTDNGLFFAVKEVSLLDKGSQGQQSIHQLEQEISLLSQFEHENIVQYLGTDKDEARLYIFLELVTKGSLASLYQKYNLRDSQVSAYTRQILNGLKYLHERNVVHRDIKCANILVDASGFVKLADFGLAKATKLNDVKSCKGTAFWMAPEVVNRKKNGYGLAADIWSLGCTVLEMLTRQIPYSHLEGMQALFRIGKGDPPPVPNSLSSDARDFIFKCLQVNPDNRPTAAQLLEHSFVKRSLQANSSPASPHYSLTRHRSG